MEPHTHTNEVTRHFNGQHRLGMSILATHTHIYKEIDRERGRERERDYDYQAKWWKWEWEWGWVGLDPCYQTIFDKWRQDLGACRRCNQAGGVFSDRLQCSLTRIWARIQIHRSIMSEIATEIRHLAFGYIMLKLFYYKKVLLTLILVDKSCKIEMDT